VEHDERVPLVPRHALGRELGLCPELSTATARWRPRGWPGWRGEGRGDPARGKEGGVESGRDTWETMASRRWPAALHGDGRRHSAPAAERNREAERWEMKSGLI
jgi:hypothetical protein